MLEKMVTMRKNMRICNLLKYIARVVETEYISSWANQKTLIG